MPPTPNSIHFFLNDELAKRNVGRSLLIWLLILSPAFSLHTSYLISQLQDKHVSSMPSRYSGIHTSCDQDTPNWEPEAELARRHGRLCLGFAQELFLTIAGKGRNDNTFPSQ